MTTAPVPSPRPTLHEVELKLRPAQAHVLDALRAAATLPGGFRLGPFHRAQEEDTYLDTAAWTLLRRGWALRVRRDPAGPLRLTAKALRPADARGVSHRAEIETVLEADPLVNLGGKPLTWQAVVERLAPPSTWAGSLALAEETRLRPVLILRQTRDKALVYPDGPGEPLAELSLDRVAIHDPADPQAGPVAVLHEVELEQLPSGDGSGFSALVSALRGAVDALPAADSKLKAGLRAVASHPLGRPAGLSGILPDMAMAAAGGLAARRQVVEMALHEAPVRGGQDPEAIHDYRVALRRLRAGLRLFEVGPEGHVAAHLRTLAKALGQVRDLDVALAELETFRAETTGTDGDLAGLDALAGDWAESRRAAHQALVHLLDDPAHDRAVRALVQWSVDVQRAHHPLPRRRSGAPRPYQVRHVMPQAVYARYARVRAYEVLPELSGLSPSDAEAAPLLHRLRLDVKQLRYALEFVRPLLGEDGPSLLAGLKDLQEILGAYQDRTVMLARLAETPYRDAPGVVRLRAAVAATRDASAARLSPAWQRVTGPAWREALGRALARL